MNPDHNIDLSIDELREAQRAGDVTERLGRLTTATELLKLSVKDARDQAVEEAQGQSRLPMGANA